MERRVPCLLHHQPGQQRPHRSAQRHHRTPPTPRPRIQKPRELPTTNAPGLRRPHPQQTPMSHITVPGERLAEIDSALTVTDVLSGAHQVCEPGDPTGGLTDQLGLSVQARDQIDNGGLDSVELTESVEVSQDATADGDAELTFVIPQPKLTLPGDGSETVTGFSPEYQYV